MALFPRLGGEFTPLFRLLDDYASHTATRPGGHSTTGVLRSFSPRFDIKEIKDAYELHGELPGIEQKNINIEFTDNSTIQISGHTEHRYTRGNPPAGFVEGNSEQGKIEGGNGYHKPTVEDEDKSSSKDKSSVQKQDGQQGVEQQQGEVNDHRWWITERSVGEFSRSFTFPGRVDQDNVKASLKNGILTVVVPKASAPQSRKINIE